MTGPFPDRISKCNAVLFECVFLFLEVEAGLRKNPRIFFHFGIFIFQGRSQGDLHNGYQVLFLIDVKIAFKPVNSLEMLIMPVKGDLVLDINENQNGGCNPHSKAQQVKQRKEFIPDSISDQG